MWFDEVSLKFNDQGEAKINMRVLVTGGAGYIGSHTCIELLAAGHEVFVVDSLCNGHLEAIKRVQKISNQIIGFTRADIRDCEHLDNVFDQFRPDAVMHFAGLKAIGESVRDPLRYYDVNVCGSINVLKAMDRIGCTKIVFSSSAAVYGDPQYLPYDEGHPTRPVNTYGHTKLLIEEVLSKWVAVNPSRRATALRYFNPVGAHVSGLIGEDPFGIPNNLMPFIAQVALGNQKRVSVFGYDYDTPDGTGLRDYIHVVDLANAHVAAIDRQPNLNPFEAINLGSGKAKSVLEMIEAFTLASGRKISYEYCPRRLGDLAECWSNPNLAAERLKWKTVHTVEQMCSDMWRWQSKNLNGFNSI